MISFRYRGPFLCQPRRDAIGKLFDTISFGISFYHFSQFVCRPRTDAVGKQIRHVSLVNKHVSSCVLSCYLLATDISIEDYRNERRSHCCTKSEYKYVNIGIHYGGESEFHASPSTASHTQCAQVGSAGHCGVGRCPPIPSNRPQASPLA